MSLRRLLLVSLIPLAWAGSAAADIDIPFPDCGMVAHLGTDCCRPNATSKLRFTVWVDGCTSVSALVGNLAVLDLPIQEAGYAVVIGARSYQGTPGSCATEVPVELEVRLPDTMEPVGMPAYVPLALYVSRSTFPGPPVLQRCGDLDLPAPFRADANWLVLHDGRFRATVGWSLPSGESGHGTVVPDSETSEGGLFSFFGAENPELLVKVLDGCAANGHFWVLGAAATNVRFVLQITDSVTGASWRHENVQDTLAPAFADTRAFPCPGS